MIVTKRCLRMDQNFSFNMRPYYFFIFMTFMIGTVVAQSNKNMCRTPNNENGSCIDLMRCPKLQLLLQRRNQIPSAVDTLRKSFCGYEGSNPKVCCPFENLSSSTSKQKNVTKESADDVKKFTAKLTSQETCGITVNTPYKIVGGKESHLGAWPWIVTLGYQLSYSRNNGLQWACGGTLVTSRYVITAAHCVTDLYNYKLVTVRLAELDLNPNANDGATPLDVPVERIIPHEKYNKIEKTYDIALVKLRNAVKFTEFIQPICLPIASNTKNVDVVSTIASIAGWGSTSTSTYRNEPPNTKLMEVDVPLLDIKYCQQAYKREANVVIDNKVLCAGYLEGRLDSCQGDSGGPLMAQLNGSDKYYLVGIVSYGNKKCGEPGFPAIYTRITTFINWIVENMNRN